MTKVTRHPNCRCGAEVGDNPYCIIHGRIRNMDAGASPFVNPDAVAAEVAEKHGIEEEDIDRDEQLDDVISRMHRDNIDRDASSILGGPVMGGGPSEADLRTEEALRGSFDALKEAAEAEPGCICDFKQDLTSGFGGPVTRVLNPRCPIHGDGARQDYDVEGTVEEDDGHDD